MSFSSTPLGQGRRLDHQTFLNKANAKRAPSSPPRRAIPTSYSYGAPTVATRSPPKPAPASIPNPAADETDEPALVRFARLKQREQAKTREAIAPEKWSFKDTSVNIAGAFNQAVEVDSGTSTNTMPPSNNPNMDAWASGVRKQALPRSTSVEYEREKQSAVSRRLAAPPSRTGAQRAPRPISKMGSATHIPDSEEELLDASKRHEREKTPLEQVVELSKRLPPVAFFMRQRSQEPEGDSSRSLNGNGNISAQDQSSYSYSAEEREYQLNAQKPVSRRGNPMHRRNRMSVDNKAYRPSMSDLEESDEDFTDDEGKKSRRKKRKSGAHGGPPLTSLPIAGYDKRKKKKKGGRANGAAEEEESSDDQSQSQSQSHSYDQSYEQPSMLPPRPPSSLARSSVPPLTSMQAQARQPSAQPDYSGRFEGSTYDVEQALATATEDELPPLAGDTSFSQSTFSIGATLGRVVHLLYRLAWGLTRLLLGVFYNILEITVHKPIQLVSSLNHAPLTQFAKYAVVGLTIYAAWYGLNQGYMSGISIPRLSSDKQYHAPEVPASNLGELSDRLLRLEHALETLSQDTQRSRVILEGEGRAQTELASRLGSLESRLQKDTVRHAETEAKSRQATTDSFKAVRQELEAIQAQIQAQREAEARIPQGPSSDEEARAKLRALEERVGSVESGVKEALDLGKSAVKVDSGSGAAWWHKLASSSAAGSALTIKSSDGQDVTALLGHLVDNAVSHWSKDVLARADYALYSSGALVIPSLTSDTVEIKPSGLLNRAVGLITGGNGYAIGRPPVTALHHEIHTGHCWPFPGSYGQLGVALSAPVFISDFTIDHVAKEVATDMRSAPRQMEVWGLIEGADNFAKLEAHKAQRHAAAELAGEPYVEEYPSTLPQNPEYMRIANFTYNIYDGHHVQTFAVPEDVRELGIDFGVVVLLVKNNWGRDDFTCLYRFRVHGEVMGGIPAPLPEDVL